jgi:DHA1 family multidrug resistance protein-like MFS transporter
MLQSLLSENTTADKQGKLLGINQSYTSLGQIVGPLIAGLISTVNLSYIFLVSAIYIAGAFVVGLLIKRPKL